jgi:mannose-1-phosphate guanylyltransferase
MAAQQNNLHVVVIAGGSGTRFWPLSRQGKPKQLLKIWDERTLLEHTIDRFQSWGFKATRWIVTTRALVEQSKAALGIAEGKRTVNFLGEPQGKNTAPCIYWALREIAKINREAVVCIVPADHFIADEMSFVKSLEQGCEYALSKGGIVTLGIRPDRPETGYGYIKLAESSGARSDDGFYTVAQFVEKPDLRTANEYLKSGMYLWNAGIFICQVSEGLRAFEKCMPSLVAVFNQYDSIDDIYAHISSSDATSIDFGVMEMAQKNGIAVAVKAVEFGWSDLGSYTALEDIDKSLVGTVVSHNAASNIVQSDDGIVALLGVNDLVVVKQGNVVLVASKDSCQDIRKLVERIKKDHPEYS